MYMTCERLHFLTTGTHTHTRKEIDTERGREGEERKRARRTRERERENMRELITIAPTRMSEAVARNAFRGNPGWS